jgi:phage tail sheath protein FI
MVTAAEPPNPTPAANNRPAVIAATNLAGGTNDDLTALGAAHYQAGIDALRAVDEVTLLCVPDRTDNAVQQYMITHCEQMQDRFAILDPGPNQDRDGALAQRAMLGSDKGFAALYYPRIRILHPDPNVSDLLTVPPSGHIAGVFAYTDDKKGVHKAPANEKIAGVLGLERTLIEADQGLLNEESVNVLRFVRGRGHRIWGARTLAESTQWRYVNVRRLMLFIEESVQEATEFAVFEPNGTPLWESLKRMVSEFLTRLWKDGMLVGVTPEQAFRVRIDEQLNPPSLRELGQLVIEVRVAPTTPAEFIVFRVIQTPGRPLIDE